MRTRLAVLMVVAVGLLLGAATASASSLVVNRLSLDSYSPTTQDRTPALRSRRLTKGKLYVATVQGTLSYYAAVDYLAIQAPFIVVCGRSLPAPLFSSRGGSGRVSNDAEFILSQPLTTGSCTSLALPRKWPNFQVNNGFGWGHPALLSAHGVTRPTASHTYDFAIVGQGRPVRFDLLDPDTRDDYGSLHITLRRAVSSDCAGQGYRAFALKRRAVCLGSTAATTGTIPKPARVRPLALDQAAVGQVLRDDDLPTEPNLQVPSGALTASQFAGLTATGAAASRREAASLTSDGFVSGAVSEFAGPGMPTITSTAVDLRTAAGARAVAAVERRLAIGQAPAGATATSGPDAAVPGAQIVTFTPQGTARGGVELVVASGRRVATLRAVQTPDAVTASTYEALLNAALARG